MKGAINYLRRLSEICRETHHDCKVCPLGSHRDIQETKCPRLTWPDSWDKEKTTDMVKI